MMEEHNAETGGSEGANHEIPGEGNDTGGQSQVKGPKMGSCLACSRNPQGGPWGWDGAQDGEDGKGRSQRKQSLAR